MCSSEFLIPRFMASANRVDVRVDGYVFEPGSAVALEIVAADGCEVVEVPLPHWDGPGDVLHLMSMLSPVAERKLLVYSRLLPVPFRKRLLAAGFELLEVPDAEYPTMAANVLALGPGRCLAIAGNPRTAGVLEKAGIEVLTYEGTDISVKGSGGPTCLTRPFRR